MASHWLCNCQMTWLEKNPRTEQTNTATLQMTTAPGIIVMQQNQHNQQETHAANTIRRNMHRVAQ